MVVVSLTSAAGDDTLPPLLSRQRSHGVVRAANFEAEYLVEVLALEPYLVPKPRTETRAVHERGLLQDLVYFGCEYELEIVGLAIRQEMVCGKAWVLGIGDALWRVGCVLDCRRGRHRIRLSYSLLIQKKR